MRQLFIIFFSFVFGMVLYTNAHAKMVSYIDDQGNIHYVNTEYSKVPERYRYQVIDQLREIEGQVISEPDEPSTLEPSSPEEGVSEDPPITRPDGSQGVIVELFVTSGCIECIFVESFLKSKKISYIKYEIDRDIEAEEKFNRLDITGVPVTKIGSELIPGVNGQKILETLGMELK